MPERRSFTAATTLFRASRLAKYRLYQMRGLLQRPMTTRTTPTTTTTSSEAHGEWLRRPTTLYSEMLDGWFRLAPWTEAKLVNIAEFEKSVQMEYPNAETNLAAEQRVFCFTQDDNSDDDDIIQVFAHEAVIEVAISIGSVIHVIHPDELPAGIRCELDISARHFKGAGVSGSHVENFGWGLQAAEGRPNRHGRGLQLVARGRGTAIAFGGEDNWYS